MGILQLLVSPCNKKDASKLLTRLASSVSPSVLRRSEGQFLPALLCTGQLSHCWDQIPDRHDKRRQGLFWLVVLEAGHWLHGRDLMAEGRGEGHLLLPLHLGSSKSLKRRGQGPGFPGSQPHDLISQLVPLPIVHSTMNSSVGYLQRLVLS